MTTSDLHSIWNSISGVAIILVLTAILLPVSGWAIDRILTQRYQLGKFELDTGQEANRLATLSGFLKTVFRLVIITFAVIALLGQFGFDTGALIASAGIAGVALGFGAQYLVKDYLTGILLVMEDQYRVGDVVTLNGVSGPVEDVNLRLTVLRDLDGTVHYIPNGEVRMASNQSKGFARVNLDLGVGYDTNLGQLIEVINQTGQELADDPEWIDKIRTPPQFVRVQEFADSAVLVKILGETEVLQQWAVTGELRKRLKAAFDEAGIEIPFPQVVVHPTATQEAERKQS